MTAWKLFLANLELISFYTSAVVAGLGFGALLLVCLCWGWVAPFYREFLAKLGVGFFRFVAAASAVASKAAAVPPDTPLTQQPWVTTALLAVAGYLLWEFAGAIGDHKHKLAKEKARGEYEQEIEALTQDKDDAERQYVWFGRVRSHLRQLANEKLQRVKRAIRDSTATRGSLPETRKGLAPHGQRT